VSHPFVAPLLPLEAAVSDPFIRLTRLESLSLFHILSLAHKSMVEELDSESPLAEKPLGARPWTTYTEFRSRPPKQRHDAACGANRSRDRYRNRREHLSHTRRTIAPMASRTQEALTAGRANQSGSRDWPRCREANVFCPRCHRCSGAATNHTLENWQPSLRRCHIRNLTVKRGKERGKKATYLE
jgi:hypothetical protein